MIYQLVININQTIKMNKMIFISNILLEAYKINTNYTY